MVNIKKIVWEESAYLGQSSKDVVVKLRVQHLCSSRDVIAHSDLPSKVPALVTANILTSIFKYCFFIHGYSNL